MDLEECFLKLAQIEEYGSEIYEKFSEECSEKLKPVVISFSQEEEKHKKIMLELLNDKKLKRGQVKGAVEKILQKQMDYSNSNGKKLNLISEKEFFQFALKLEKNSIEIYTELLKMFEINSYEYKNFEALIKEEKNHMVYILNKLYELK
jgi:rubrerythrin